MAKNAMTPDQDILTRRFFIEVAEKAESIIPDAAASARQLRAILLMMLNYDQTPDGKFVEKGVLRTRPFGNNDFSAYECEWEKDFEAAIRRDDDQANDTVEGTTEASTREPTARSKIW